MKITNRRFISIGFIIIIIVALGVTAGALYRLKQQKTASISDNISPQVPIISSQTDNIITATTVVTTTPEVPAIINEKSCQSDLDCACGTNIKTGNCFSGNKKYVNTEKQCPDFCTGIADNFTTRCLNNLCDQVKNK
jgi:hypothetical protein